MRQKWVNQANKLRNITVVSIGGGYRDYLVRSGLTSLPCSSKDPNKLSLVVGFYSFTSIIPTQTSSKRLKENLCFCWCIFFFFIQQPTNDDKDVPMLHTCVCFRRLQYPGHGCPLTICPSFGKMLDLIYLSFLEWFSGFVQIHPKQPVCVSGAKNLSLLLSGPSLTSLILKPDR